MLVLMTVLVVFARIAKTASAEIQAPALVFTWFALLLTMATAFLLFTSVFFVTPVDLKRVFSLVEPSSSKGIAPPDVAAAENEQTPLNLKTAQVKPMDSHRPPDDAGTFGIRVQNAPTPHDLSNEQLVKISMSNFRPGRLADSQLSLASQTPTGLKVVNVLASSSASKAGDSFACSDLTSHLNADSRPQQAKQLSRRACWWGEQEACKSVDPITYADIVEDTHRHTERHRVKR